MEITFEVNTKAGWANDEAERKRRAIEELECGLPPKKPKRGRKPNPKAKTLTRKTPTRLRKDRPVATKLVTDVWETILVFCPLEKLLKLRTLSATFHSVLANDRVWKIARQHQFGPDHPPAPNGLTEWQYGDLLLGIGCHGAGCKEKSTRRTYWAFQRRWCEKCCHNNIKKERCAKDQLEVYERASKCIPHAMFDSWNHYQWAGHHDTPPPWAGTYGAQTPVYSKFDIEKFNLRYRDFLLSNPKEEEIDQWFNEQEKVNTKCMTQLQKIETWIELDKIRREKERLEIKEKRAAFFQEKAMSLSPPLEADVLDLCPSYERSIQISKSPSDKAWRILCDKLSEERTYASVRLARKKRARYHEDHRDYLEAKYHNNFGHRPSMTTFEQRLALNLADMAIHNLLLDSNGISESDIVNVVLRDVFSAYQLIPDEEKPSSPTGPYRLIMDDARVIYKHRILPLISCFNDIRTENNAKKLKCPEHDHGDFDFEELMEHLRTPHLKIKNIDTLSGTFSGKDTMSLWHLFEWPQNLPMQATHQAASVEWDTDAAISYTRAPPPGISLLDQLISPSHQSNVFKALPIFTSSILRVAGMLQKLEINPRYKALIAIEFALRGWRRVQGAPIDASELEMLSPTLETFGYGDVFESTSCIRCRKQKPSSTFYQQLSLKSMAQHYIREHIQSLQTRTLFDSLMPLHGWLPTENGRTESNDKATAALPHIGTLFKFDNDYSLSTDGSSTNWAEMAGFNWT